MSGIQIAPAHITDISAIQALAQAAYQQTLSHTHDEAAIERFLKRVYSADSLHRTLGSSALFIKTAYRDNQLVGFIQAGSPLLDECLDRKEIHRLLVHPHVQRCGIGGQLLQAILADLRQQPHVTRCSCYVPVADVPRQAFFSKKGFIHLAHEDKDTDQYWERNL